jgi:hypothetical protein
MTEAAKEEFGGLYMDFIKNREQYTEPEPEEAQAAAEQAEPEVMAEKTRAVGEVVAKDAPISSI